MNLLDRRELRSFHSFLDQIWHKYDVDGSNSISVKETKQLLVDISGHKRVNQQDCRAFVKHIETTYRDPGSVPRNAIKREHLESFIQGGIELDEERIEDLATVFPLQYLSMFEQMKKRN